MRRLLLPILIVILLLGCRPGAPEPASIAPIVPDGEASLATPLPAVAAASPTALPTTTKGPVPALAPTQEREPDADTRTASPYPALPTPLAPTTPTAPTAAVGAVGPYPGSEDETSPGAPASPTTAYPTATSASSGEAIEPEPVWSYRIVSQYPHDFTAYTQGLVVEQGAQTLLEGTGRDSSLRRVDLQTGNIEQAYWLPDDSFGEGITRFGDKVIQLTWQGQKGYVYDSESFEVLGEFSYPHEGWGITHDESLLIVSDGTDIIRFWDPQTFREVRRIQVTGQSGPLTQLNELEFVNGEIWANIWHTDAIARISPENGRVLGWIDLRGLMDPQLLSDPEAVLNGIAYDRDSGRLFVTGKLWPLLFEIEIVQE